MYLGLQDGLDGLDQGKAVRVDLFTNIYVAHATNT